MFHLDSVRRRVLLAFISLVVATSIALRHDVSASAPSDGHWVGTWTAAAQGVVGAPSQFGNQTLRLIVRTTVGGDQVRVRLSNELGTQRLVIGAARIALRSVAESIDPATDRALMFGGAASIIVPAGAPALSDPVTLDVPPLSELAISIYLPQPTPVSTVHLLGLQTSYVSAPDSGDLTAADTLLTPIAIGSWPLLTAVHVKASKRADAIVILGDSITEGMGSTRRRRTDDGRMSWQSDCRLDRASIIFPCSTWGSSAIGCSVPEPVRWPSCSAPPASRVSIATFCPSPAWVL